MKITNDAIYTRKEDLMIIFDVMNECAIKGDPEYSPTLKIFDRLIVDMGNKCSSNEEQLNKFKGDIFEVFCELYSLMIRSKNTCGFIDYDANNEDDYGVDGYAFNYAGEKCAVQVKFRSNTTEKITWESLAKTAGQAHMNGVEQLIPNSIILFTNCLGANDFATHVLEDTLYVVNRDIIESEVDGNITFWKDCYKVLEENCL